MVGGANTANTTATTANMANINTTSSASGTTDPLEFACSLCSTSFPKDAERRTHMKSPWHVYNLKRRMASLPSLNEKVFEETVAAESKEHRNAFRGECSACQKTFDNPKAYQTHLKSRNHLQKQKLALVEDVEEPEDDLQHLATMSSHLETLKISESESDADENDGDEDEDEDDTEDVPEFDESVCLFCLEQSSNLEANMQHMQTAHKFIIPHQEALIDLDSFLAYLHTLIAVFNECIYCGCVRSNAGGVRAHMRDKAHCMVDIGEIEEFYDSADDLPADMRGANETAALPGRIIDDELSLPSGKILGHRSRARIYRQNLPTPEVREQRRAIEAAAAEASENKDRRVVSRAEGGMGLIGLSEAQRRSLRVVERKMVKIEMRARNDYQAGLERRFNKQKFFVNDVPGPRNG